jgi:hypothetical protein
VRNPAIRFRDSPVVWTLRQASNHKQHYSLQFQCNHQDDPMPCCDHEAICCVVMFAASQSWRWHVTTGSNAARFPRCAQNVTELEPFPCSNKQNCSHSGHCILGSDAVQSGRSSPTFRRNVLPLFVTVKSMSSKNKAVQLYMAQLSYSSILKMETVPPSEEPVNYKTAWGPFPDDSFPKVLLQCAIDVRIRREELGLCSTAMKSSHKINTF